MPNSKYLGSYFDDKPFQENASTLHDTGHLLSDKVTIEAAELSVSAKSSHSWSTIFTVLGTVLLDSMADSCQSPARSYLVDVCHPGTFGTTKQYNNRHNVKYLASFCRRSCQRSFHVYHNGWIWREFGIRNRSH